MAPTLGAVTALCVGKDLKTGEVDVAEVGNQIPGQMTMEDVERNQETTQEIEGRLVDMETGEITEPAGKVVDLRAAREA